MNTRSILLLTHDVGLQATLTEALRGESANVRVTEDVGAALRTVCGQPDDLDFAIIDFDDGCHGMTLLSALNVCRPGLPVIVVISADLYHVAALAYANGVAGCLARPFDPADLRIVITGLRQPKLQLAA